MSEELSVGELIDLYVSTRDELKEKRKKFKEEEADAKEKLEKIETKILSMQRALGVTSLSTNNFTAFQTEKTFVRMGNWDKFSEWVLETGNIQCVEKRPAKLACLEVEREDEISLSEIGIEKTKEICVQIRRK